MLRMAFDMKTLINVREHRKIMFINYLKNVFHLHCRESHLVLLKLETL